MKLAAWLEAIDNKDIATYVILGLFIMAVTKAVGLAKTSTDAVSIVNALWLPLAVVLGAIFGEKYLVARNGTNGK